ncbi:MAG: PH domain-containing protein [Armatimonadetes bacterium]|nr:PH domain-containing protein [Armatimonadota bacterium]
MRFKTKVDWWLGVIIVGAPTLMLGLMIATGDTAWWIGTLLFFAIIAALCWPCAYTFGDKNLVIRSGLIRWRVPYSMIYRVRPTRNPLSSPAWSLDRLAIHYGKRWIMVSPNSKDQFLTELMNRAGLRQQGEELVMPD